VIAIVMLMAAAAPISGNVYAQTAVAGCDTAATPPATPESADSTPSAADIDGNLAWMWLQHTLAEEVNAFSTVAGQLTVSPELTTVVLQQGIDAQGDMATLQPLLPAGEDLPLEQVLAVADSTRQELDLPAGQGGSGDLGAAQWIATLCAGSGVDDILIANASIDLSQQQIDLAQVAIAAGSPESQAMGQAIIDRESARISAVLVLLANASPMASPNATPGS
jgi:hypothetical protein